MIIYYDNGSHPLLRQHFINSGVSFTTIYRSPWTQRVERFTRHRFRPRSMLFNLPECPESDDKVICFDTYTNSEYFRWLCKHYASRRILLWFWNPVGNIHRLDMHPRRIEIWSYSRQDCEAYGFHYNTSFYFDDLAQKAMDMPAAANPVPVVLFVGRDKGREAIIRNLREELVSAGAKTDFHIVRNDEKRDRARGREHLLPYDEIVERICRADAILDYSMTEQAGLSLRVMEALFWRKKLITNNQSVRDSDFYEKDNVYLLGQETRSMADFLKAPMTPVPREIMEKYLLSSWLRRFDA